MLKVHFCSILRYLFLFYVILECHCKREWKAWRRMCSSFCIPDITLPVLVRFSIYVRTLLLLSLLYVTLECFCWPWQKSRDILDVSTIVFSGIKVLCLYERAQCCISLHAGKKHLLRTLYYWLRCTYVRPYVCAWGRVFHFDQTHFIFWQNISPHSFKRESSVEAI